MSICKKKKNLESDLGTITLGKCHRGIASRVDCL